ncbi:phosphoglycerate mutase family protein [soil metagenome]
MISLLLVRHADIDLPPVADNPTLNPAGKDRADKLARVASAAGISAIFTSSITRTKETAAPLAAKLGWMPQVIPATPEFVTNVRAGAYGPVVLVVGHSNTVPPLIDALMKTTSSIAIGENEFDNLFIVSVMSDDAQLLRMKY